MSEIRTRREPPRFRLARVAAIADRTPHLVRVTLASRELEGLDPGLPAASVRLLLPRPTPDGPVLELPVWNGNEFRDADGGRPLLRTLTPVRVEGDELDVEVVRHGAAPLSSWVDAAAPGDEVAVSGTGRGYEIDPAAPRFVVAGDEAALPAITTLLAALPEAAEVAVHVEVRDPSARLDFPPHPGATVRWHTAVAGAPPGDALVAAVAAEAIDPDTRVWAAGEAAAVQRIRRLLGDERGLPRSHAVVRGYWKVGRGGDADG